MATFALSVRGLGARAPIGQVPHTLQVRTTVSTTWKNLGYYVAGSVWEEWETQGKPASVPPSLHSLVGLSSWPEN